MPKQQRKVLEKSASSDHRRSGRLRSSGKYSKYFEADSDSDNKTKQGGDLKRVESGDPGAHIIRRNKKRARGRPTNNGPSNSRREFGDGDKKAKVELEDRNDDFYVEQKEEEQKEDDEDDDDEDDFEKNRYTITPLIKMRDLGGIPYEDDRLHPNTLLFLLDLRANNERSWLKSHDGEYRRSLQDWTTYAKTLTPKIIEADSTIPELPMKDVIFRIYRDIRFSKDHTPYKPYYSVAFSRTGRKGPYACYYIHCEAGSNNSFVGGGLWMPGKEHLAALRRSIDEHPARWRRLLSDERFRKTFLPRAKAGDEEGCVKAFAEANKEGALKKKPKASHFALPQPVHQDYNADHRDIELLKLRNFTIGKKISERIFTAEDGQDQIVAIVRAMVGFITFLNSVVMPDPLDSESNSDEEGDDVDEDGGEDEG